MSAIASMWGRRALLRYLIASRLKIQHANLVLGYLWWVLEPLILMLVYWFLVSKVFGHGGREYPLFILCGLIPFRAVNVSLAQSPTSISGRFSLISQVDFPRLFLPLADIIANHVKFLLGLGVLLVFAAASEALVWPRLPLVVLPILMQFGLVCGMAMAFAVFGAYVPDFRNGLQFALRIWIYASPVLYDVERVPANLKWLYVVNPMTAILGLYRFIFMEAPAPEWSTVSVCLAEIAVLLLAGYWIFATQEKKILRLI